MDIIIEPEWTVTTGSYIGAHRVDGPGRVYGHIDGLGEVEVELIKGKHATTSTCSDARRVRRPMGMASEDR
ncbi:hypothetical protein VSR68_39345 [Paraburkholderia phymatum]